MKRKFPVGLIIAEFILLGLEALLFRYVMREYNIAYGFDRFATVVFTIVILIAFDCLVAVCTLIKNNAAHYTRKRALAFVILTLALSCAATRILWVSVPEKIAAMKEDMAADAKSKAVSRNFEVFHKAIWGDETLTDAGSDETPVITAPFSIVQSKNAGLGFEYGGKEQFFGSSTASYTKDLLGYVDVMDSRTVVFVYTQGKSHMTTRGYWAYSNGQKAEDAYVYDVYMQVVNLDSGVRYQPIWFSEVLTKEGSCYYDSNQYQTGDFASVFKDFTKTN
jgi:hypothetical protein